LSERGIHPHPVPPSVGGLCRLFFNVLLCSFTSGVSKVIFGPSLAYLHEQLQLSLPSRGSSRAGFPEASFLLLSSSPAFDCPSKTSIRSWTLSFSIGTPAVVPFTGRIVPSPSFPSFQDRPITWWCLPPLGINVFYLVRDSPPLPLREHPPHSPTMLSSLLKSAFSDYPRNGLIELFSPNALPVLLRMFVIRSKKITSALKVWDSY